MTTERAVVTATGELFVRASDERHAGQIASEGKLRVASRNVTDWNIREFDV